MSRPSPRRTPSLETLETRQVLSTVVGPSADQQYALELINLVRTNPSQAGIKLTNNLSPAVQSTLSQFNLKVSDLRNQLNAATPQQPLAWSDALGSSAQAQSQYQANNGVQTHQGPGEAGLGERISSAGFKASTYGENTYAYAESIDQAMQSFLFDWGVADHGHYNNLLQPGTAADGTYRDVGIGLVNTSGRGVGPLVLTQDFGGQSSEAPQILGVVYNDPNHTGSYAPGQGQAGVTIDALNLNTGKDFQVQSFGSGGYQVPVDANGDYKVTAIQNGRVISSQQVHISNLNAKVDFVHDPANDVTGPVAPAPVAPTPAPVAPTPTPAPAPAPVPTSPALNLANFKAFKAPQTAPAPAPAPAPQVLIPTLVQQPQSPVASPSWLSGWSRWTANNSQG